MDESGKEPRELTIQRVEGSSVKTEESPEGGEPVPVGTFPDSPGWRDSTGGVTTEEDIATPEFSRMFMSQQGRLGRFIIEANEPGDGLPVGKGYAGCQVDGCGWVGRENQLKNHQTNWHDKKWVKAVIARKEAYKKKREARGGSK